jgi:hypothetical protein
LFFYCVQVFTFAACASTGTAPLMCWTYFHPCRLVLAARTLVVIVCCGVARICVPWSVQHHA